MSRTERLLAGAQPGKGSSSRLKKSRPLGLRRLKGHSVRAGRVVRQIGKGCRDQIHPARFRAFAEVVGAATRSKRPTLTALEEPFDVRLLFGNTSRKWTACS